MSDLGIPPGSDFIFQAVPKGDGTWDVIDTRTGGVNQNQPTQPLAAAACAILNGTLDAI